MMFPVWMQGHINRKYGTSANDIAAAILIACGPMLEVKLGGRSLQAEELFALQTVTSDHQQQASKWLTEYWDEIDKRPTRTAVMPPVGTDKWWTFVSWFMNAEYDFGVKKRGHKKDESTARQLVPNGFWKTHKIDAIQVGLAHRLRVQTQLQKGVSVHFDVPLMREGRPYGVLKEKKRKCFRCPTSRPEIMCVRQNGTGWLCSHPDLSIGAASRCHRDYHIPIDTGYLDIEIPNDEREDAMSVEEVNDEEEEEKYQEVLNNLAKLPTPHQHLLADLGFVSGVYEVTTQQMQKAWESATEVDYLEALQLSECARNSIKLKTVRREALKLLHRCNLVINTKRKWSKGNNVNIYLLSSY
jgi:hypothetical protein